MSQLITVLVAYRHHVILITVLPAFLMITVPYVMLTIYPIMDHVFFVMLLIASCAQPAMSVLNVQNISKLVALEPVYIVSSPTAKPVLEIIPAKPVLHLLFSIL